jgi:hypothetical protein
MRNTAKMAIVTATTGLAFIVYGIHKVITQDNHQIDKDNVGYFVAGTICEIIAAHQLCCHNLDNESLSFVGDTAECYLRTYDSDMK